jgi:hypothetical protein
MKVVSSRQWLTSSIELHQSRRICFFEERICELNNCALYLRKNKEMGRIATLLLLTGVLYLSSCSNNNTTTSLYVVPSVDSVTKGSYVNVTFTSLPKHFYLNDMIVSNSPVISETAVINNIAPDSLWSLALIITDHKAKTISINLSAFDSTTTLVDTFYYVMGNGSTLTDFSGGTNLTYSISIGSWIYVTHSDPSYMTGKLHLNLYYDHDTTLAYGDFKIFH